MHGFSHYGEKKMIKLMGVQYWWPRLDIDAATHVMLCTECNSFKPHRKLPRPWMKFATTSRLKTVHMDIVGPVPTSHSGKKYLLTMIDRFSRWIEAVPLSRITAETCSKAFYETWISRYGVPETIVSDQGAQFESVIFK